MSKRRHALAPRSAAPDAKTRAERGHRASYAARGWNGGWRRTNADRTLTLAAWARKQSQRLQLALGRSRPLQRGRRKTAATRRSRGDSSRPPSLSTETQHLVRRKSWCKFSIKNALNIVRVSGIVTWTSESPRARASPVGVPWLCLARVVAVSGCGGCFWFVRFLLAWFSQGTCPK